MQIGLSNIKLDAILTLNMITWQKQKGMYACQIHFVTRVNNFERGDIYFSIH